MRWLSPVLALALTLSAGGVAAQSGNTEEGFRALLEGDQRKFFEHALKDAENGIAEAQLAVGTMYERGLSGSGANFVEAARWYRRAADAGLADADLALARLYMNGRGVPRDEVEGNRWLERAITHGSLKASDFLGDSYLVGRGVAKDPARAVSHYQRAAQGNIVQSQAKLAGFYFKGDIVPQDRALAYFWARLVELNREKMPGVDAGPIVQAIASRLTPAEQNDVEQRVQAFTAKFATRQ